MGLKGNLADALITALEDSPAGILERGDHGVTTEQARDILAQMFALAGSDPCFVKAGEDEPLFVLRSTDRVAPGTVRDWAYRAKGAGCLSLEKIQDAMDQAGRMDEWQARHPRLVKIPD